MTKTMKGDVFIDTSWFHPVSEFDIIVIAVDQVGENSITFLDVNTSCSSGNMQRMYFGFTGIIMNVHHLI